VEPSVWSRIVVNSVTARVAGRFLSSERVLHGFYRTICALQALLLRLPRSGLPARERNRRHNRCFFGERYDDEGQPRKVCLYRAKSTPIKRHIKVQGEANPYDPAALGKPTRWSRSANLRSWCRVRKSGTGFKRIKPPSRLRYAFSSQANA
jgi:hypothetical protein